MPGNLQLQSLSHLSIPLPGWITNCLLRSWDNTAPCGSHVNSKQKSSHSKEPLIMQLFSKDQITLSVTVSVTPLHSLLQLRNSFLEKGCLCLKQQNVNNMPPCEGGSQNFCVPEIALQKWSTTSRLISDKLKVVFPKFPVLCKRCWSQYYGCSSQDFGSFMKFLGVWAYLFVPREIQKMRSITP